MNKDKIIQDWLSNADNRSKLLRFNINKSQSELLFSMADIYRVDGVIIFIVNETIFIPEFTEPNGISGYSNINNFLQERND